MGEIIGTVSRKGETYSVMLTAESAFDRKTIWRAITEQHSLERWLGTVSGPIMTGKAFEVTYPNDSNYSIRARLRERRVPSSLVLSWKFNDLPTNFVRISLNKLPEGGTQVQLEVTGLLRHDAATAAATWHTQMEFLRNHLHGQEVLGHALRFRRDELIPAYERQLTGIGAPALSRQELLEQLQREQGRAPQRADEVRRVLHTHAYLA
ncbi:SRPBCC domain-containing protein [Gulosibacter sp. 10]|uniref:SRPBCC domain-containing protein n=1 Tax=Gulosibacter sp. 10 TaxID=1255570 RepID=UPI00097F25BB|nr:SRPBCC domain-containing protein [Gulosibacter sp. 10]SJM68019.1 hypothetical protein FM112_13070 [Gulosibacter sp. 10]